jgi:DinB superfamily
MGLHEQTINRLCNQYKIIRHYIDDLPPQAIVTRFNPDKWSIHETIAYLSRYHYVFMNRIKDIRTQVNPFFEVYDPEQDPEFRFTTAHSTGSLLHEIDRLRTNLKHDLEIIPVCECSRVGTHAVLGKMNLCQWLEFFLLHESNQLYKIFRLATSFWSNAYIDQGNVITMPLNYAFDERAG